MRSCLFDDMLENLLYSARVRPGLHSAVFNLWLWPIAGAMHT